MQISKLLLTIISSIFILISCKEKETYYKLNKSALEKSTVHEIIVVEAVSAGTYTYLKVNEKGNIFWIAIPLTDVKIGDTYFYNGGVVMKNFESKQLKKTFDFILFVDAIRKTKDLTATTGTNTLKKSKAFSKTDIKLTFSNDVTTIASLFKNKQKLSSKNIKVKGIVVKVNKAIMDRNWIHIMDGTNYNNKTSITVTSTDMVKVGDTAIFSGTLTLNKDFGQGYTYDVILEQAQLQK